ncbi:MAG: GLUG motif-containing protein [Candidatus Cryptobacteroides sp.]|nr:GLUG motif-containing protein [Candidatus Cryptobacteroides sp.]
MKKSRLLALLALSAVLAGCAETIAAPDVKPEDKPGEEPGAELQTITVGLPEEVVAPDGTKVTFTPGDNGLALNWADGDAITLIGETTETYTLKSGAGTKVAVFEGKEVVKPENGDYTVIYPSSFTTVEAFKAGNYQGQVQNGNGNTDHLKFHAMASSSSLEFSFSGENVTVNGAMKLQMKLPASLTNPTGITVAADSPVFYTTNDGSAPVSEMKLALKNVTIGEDHMLTAYLMTSPQKVEIAEGTNLTFTVETTIEENPFKYEKTITPGAISIPAGKLNVITLNAEDWKRHSGSGTADDPYLLYAVEDLQAMRSFLVHGQKVWFKLMDDIDMSGIVDWEPLNYADPYDYEIDFNGNHKTISNMKSSFQNYPSFTGVLFGELYDVCFDNAQIKHYGNCGVVGGYIGTGGKPGYVHDITVTNSKVELYGTTDNLACGGLASNAKEARIENCDVQIDVINSSTSSNFRNATGGIVGKTLESNNILKNLTFRGTVKSNTEKYTGGIVGWQCNAGVNIEGCTVDAEIIAVTEERVGGIAGHFDGGTIKDCVVKGSVIQQNSKWNTGGIAGIVGQKSEIVNCIVEASVSSKASGIGGILGQAEKGVDITGCTVSGSVKTGNIGYVGGICAQTNNATSTFKSCTVSGAISGGWYVGGILGYNNNADTYIQDCKCSSTITCTGGNNGGIVALSAEGKVMQIERCEFSGTISGGDNIGGIIGLMRKNSNSASYVKDCKFSGTIDNAGQKVGGIVGELATWGQIYNCISTGNITGWQAVGGICGRADGEGWEHIYNQANKVEKCLVWGGTITATRKNENGGSSAVVVGHTSIMNQLTDCFRSSDVVFNGSWNESPYDQENSNNETNLNCTPIPGTNYYYAYHGKVSGGTASAKAAELGWDTNVWNLSGEVPVLK